MQTYIVVALIFELLRINSFGNSFYEAELGNKWYLMISMLIVKCSSWRQIQIYIVDHSRGWPEGSLFDSYYTKV